MARFSSVPHVALALEDPEGAARFYVERRGFEVRERRRDEVEVALGSLHLHLGRGHAATEPVWFSLETDGVSGAARDLEAAGCRVTHATGSSSGGVLVRDPFGVGFYITVRDGAQPWG